ncbi:hypothetical protein ACO0SA_003804 [Hanseniaspora valbyensis]
MHQEKKDLKTSTAKKGKYKRTFKVTWGGRPYKSKKEDSFVKITPNVKVIDGVFVLDNTDKNKKKAILKKNKKLQTQISKKDHPILTNISQEGIKENNNNINKSNSELQNVTNLTKQVEQESVNKETSSTNDFVDSMSPRNKDVKIVLSPFNSTEPTNFPFINQCHDNKNSPFGPFIGVLPGLEYVGDNSNFLNENISQNNNNNMIELLEEEEEEDNNNITSLDESVAYGGRKNISSLNLNTITPSLTTSFDFIQFFIQQSGTMFTPVSGAGHLYRNTNPFLTILPNIAFRDSLTFNIMEEFAKVAIASTTLRNHRLIGSNISSVSSNEDSNMFTATPATNTTTTNISSSSNKSLIEDMNIEEYMSSENIWDFIDERLVLKNFRDTYKQFEIKSLKTAAQILAEYQLTKGQFDPKRVNNGVANLLLLLVYNSYFGKHNKNVNMILSTCRELLSVFNQDANDSKIKISSEHAYKSNTEFDTNRFFTQTAVQSANQPTIERETQFLANWTNYNDLLTSLTFLPEIDKKRVEKQYKKFGYRNQEIPSCNYSYIVDCEMNRMEDFKDIEYFSGVDLQVMKYMNELTRLLSMKHESEDSISDDTYFITQCEQLSDDIELYLIQSERERDFMIYESINNNHCGKTENAIKEYQNLRTVNKVFALISILQVQRRLLGKMTSDEKVKSILFELIILIDEKVSKASAQAQCLFGSIFIIGCELGNLCNIEDASQKKWAAILKKGKNIVMSHFDALVDRGVIAAERAKEIIYHIWITNSLNTTYKDWWQILKENKINIHLSL